MTTATNIAYSILVKEEMAAATPGQHPPCELWEMALSRLDRLSEKEVLQKALKCKSATKSERKVVEEIYDELLAYEDLDAADEQFWDEEERYFEYQEDVYIP